MITGSAVCQGTDGVTVRFCCGAATLVLDLMTNAWSKDTPPADVLHTKVCDTENGPTLGRKALTDALASTKSGPTSCWMVRPRSGATSNGLRFIQPGVKLACRSWPIGVRSFRPRPSSVSSTGSAYPNANVAVNLSIDGTTTPDGTRSMIDFLPTDYRKLNIRARQGSAAVLSFTTLGAPWRFIGWTLEVQDLGGQKRAPVAEYI